MLRFETAGESHGECLVATLTGLPAGIPICMEYLNRQLWRRQQGYGRGGRMKIETDRVRIVSGVRHSQTIGSPVALLIENKDWKNWTGTLPVESKDAEPGKEKPSSGLVPDMPILRARLNTTSAKHATCWSGPALAKPQLESPSERSPKHS